MAVDKPNKTLSIVVPSYNMEKYLPRCLNSFIASEILEKIEVLIVNDGSKDSTLEIAKDYQEKYPNTFIAVDKQNGGHGSTINKGIELAVGRYFKVVDADDWLDTQALIKLVDFLESTSADIVITGYNTVTAGSADVQQFQFRNVEFNKIYTYKDVVKMGITIPMHSISYKTSILRDNSIRLQEGIFYVDIEYNLLPVPYVNKIAFFDVMLYQYFLGRPDQSVSRNSMLRNYDHTVRVDRRILTVYTNVEMNEWQRKYYKNYLIKLIKNHYCFLPNLPDKPKENYKRCKEYDSMVKELSLELYNDIEDWYIKVIRGSKFKAVKFLTVIQPIWSYKIKNTLKIFSTKLLQRRT